MQGANVSLSQLAQLAASKAAQHKVQDGGELRETARQFEALFVKQLLSQIDVSGGFGGADNAQSDFVNSMWRDRISQQMTQGEGLGLAGMLVRQLGGEAPAAVRAGNSLAQPLADLRARGAELYAMYGADSTRFDSREDFVAALKPHLERAARELGVSPQVLLAQAALETGWGRHMPRAGDGRPSNNLFGIKADAGWTGDAVQSRTAEYVDGRYQTVQAGFRQYPGVAESVRDYVDFLKSNPRYQPALAHGGSDENFLQGLKSAGYATDPQYVEKIIGVAEGPSMAQYWNAI